MKHPPPTSLNPPAQTTSLQTTLPRSSPTVLQSTLARSATGLPRHTTMTTSAISHFYTTSQQINPNTHQIRHHINPPKPIRKQTSSISITISHPIPSPSHPISIPSHLQVMFVRPSKKLIRILTFTSSASLSH